MLRSWLEQTIDNEDAQKHPPREEIQQEFQKLDADVKKLAKKEPSRQAMIDLPTAAYGQVATLKHEADKEETKRSVTSSAQFFQRCQAMFHDEPTKCQSIHTATFASTVSSLTKLQRFAMLRVHLRNASYHRR